MIPRKPSKQSETILHKCSTYPVFLHCLQSKTIFSYSNPVFQHFGKDGGIKTIISDTLPFNNLF